MLAGQQVGREGGREGGREELVVSAVGAKEGVETLHCHTAGREGGREGRREGLKEGRTEK